MALTQVKTTGIADDAVTEAKVANDAIGITEMKAGTDGHVITYDASGNPTTVGPGTDGQVLTSTGAGSPPAFETINIPSGTTINNQGDNRVITSTATTDTLNGEAGLTYNGQKIVINTVTSEGSAIKLYDTTANSQVWYVNGEGNSFIGHTYPRTDANLDLGYHTGYRWRDVVLSGGVRFGTSSADNYLDDYEEGTYTVTLTGQSAGSIALYGTDDTLAYTKVGNIVHVHGRIRLYIVNNSMSGQARISLPFTAAAGTEVSNGGMSSVATHGVTLDESSDIGMFLESSGNTSNGYLTITRYSQSWTAVTANQFGGLGATSNHYLAFNHTYQAA